MSRRLPIFQEETVFVNAFLCTACGGQCCKDTPGASSPSDFLDEDGDLDELTIFEMLSSGDWVLAFWDGDPREKQWGERRERGLDRVSIVYYPRPAFVKKSDEGLLERRYQWDLGGCVFLTEQGCKFSFSERPYGCRTLVPDWDLESNLPSCKHDGLGDNQRAALEWLPHQEKLMEIAREVEPGELW